LQIIAVGEEMACCVDTKRAKYPHCVAERGLSL
jgi:hypothetical protein